MNIPLTIAQRGFFFANFRVWPEACLAVVLGFFAEALFLLVGLLSALRVFFASDFAFNASRSAASLCAASSGLIVIERALFGLTTKGFGPDRVPIGVPSASRFGPEPG
ncbi:MAG TPA: hypothetical protein DCW57_05275, partial [Planctomycetaceae bacterium]|nr:hypothetical protein [Planctomycetaceae bacterium]